MKDPRDYLRHPRGRGKLTDDAEVSSKAFLSKTSVVAGKAKVLGGSVYKTSLLTGRATMFDGKVVNSIICGETVLAGNPLIINSVVACRSISGNACVKHAEVLDKADIRDGVLVEGASLSRPIIIKDSALIYGTAILIGQFTVGGMMRLASGIWNRAPRYLDLGFCTMTESTLGCMVGCRDRTLDYWLRHGAKLGQRWGWTDDQIVLALKGVKYVATGE